MKDIFTRLRKKPSETSFAASLFAPRWWRTRQEPSRESVVCAEKEEAIRSLESFVTQKQTNGVESIKFPGGEISPKRVETKIDIGETNTEQFYQELESCQLCPQQNGVPQFDRSMGQVQVLFVTDFPGLSIDKEQLFDRMIAAMKLESFAKTLAIKCDCQGEVEDEWESMGPRCRKHLHREIALMKPEVVLTFGAVATRLLLDQDVKLSKVHGKFHPQEIESGSEKFKFQVVPIFHLDLLTINPNMKKITWEDLQGVMRFLDDL